MLVQLYYTSQFERFWRVCILYTNLKLFSFLYIYSVFFIWHSPRKRTGECTSRIQRWNQGGHSPKYIKPRSGDSLSVEFLYLLINFNWWLLSLRPSKFYGVYTRITCVRFLSTVETAYINVGNHSLNFGRDKKDNSSILTHGFDLYNWFL